MQSLFTILINLTKGNYIKRQHYLETIETVLAWDLPDEVLADAINQQFAYMTNQTGDVNDYDQSLQ